MNVSTEYREYGVRIGPSECGMGVFALHPFVAGALLGPISGEIFDDELYESDYCMELGTIGCIEPDAPFRYLNHSCQPNCRLIEYEVEQDDDEYPAELWLSVESDIPQGEQLTIDYGWAAEHAIPCQCGSSACRHWIVAADQLGQMAEK